MSSRNSLKRFGLNTPPCRTPYIFSNISPWWPPHFTRDVAFRNMLWITDKKFPTHPWFINLNRRADRFIKSNADLKSTKHIYKGRPLALHLSMIPFNKKTLSMALAFGLNPFYKGSPKERHSFANCRRLFRMPSKIFPIAGVIVILR